MTEKNQQLLFEKYAIEECLKKDDFSAVYIADHIYLQKKIILKVLDTHEIPDKSIVERFKREAKLLAHLEHPNLIKVLDFGSHEKFFYISVEYFNSKNLRAVMRQNGLSVEQKSNLMRQLLLGVNYVHENSVIHRDLKPENILVSDSLELKIGDFGLAIGTKDDYVTAKDSIVGTPCYMSPEQVRGEALTEKSDLFSLGIVLYELFAGVNPFLGKDINATFNEIVGFNEEQGFVIPPVIPPDAEKVIRGLLKSDPMQRHCGTGEVVKAELSETITEAEPSARNRRALYMVSGLVFFLLILSIAGYFFFLKPVQNSKVETSAPQNTLAAQKEVDKTDAVKAQNASDTKDAGQAKTQPKDAATIVTPPNNKDNVPVGNTPVSPKQGKLSVECRPWAYVFIDSALVETTPLKNDLAVPVGQHVLLLTHPNYPVFLRRIMVQESQIVSIRVNLDTLFGSLDCKVNPWGEIYVDGKLMGETPLPSAIKLIPGEHQVVLKNSAFPQVQYQVRIEQNKVYTLKHVFKSGE